MFERFQAALLTALLSASAAEAAPLFKGYEAGTPRAVMERLPGVYPCDGRLLCLDDQTFLGETVHLAFIFDRAGLANVSVNFSDTDTSAYELFEPLSAAGFQLVGILNGTSNELLDMVLLSHTEQSTSAERKFVEFATIAENSGLVNFVFVETTDSLKAKVSGVRSYGDLMRVVPADTRAFEIQVDNNEGTLFVVFYLPGAEGSTVETEDF